MVMRGDWQLKYVEKCVHHRLELVPLWETSHLLQRYDYAARFQDRGVFDKILTGLSTHPTTSITAYDRWLNTRLTSEHDTTWLATHNIDIAARFCMLLGTELIRTGLSAGKANSSGSAQGFEIASRGPAAIRQSLKALVSKADGPHDRANKAFGRIPIWINQYATNDPRWHEFRELMRDVVIETWPYAAGEVIFGKALPTRRLHSISSAAKEIGRSDNVTRQILEHAGVVSAEDRRPDKRLTFDAIRAAPALSKAKRLVMAKHMARHLGASPNQFEVLREQGVIRPAIPPSISKFHWDTADADELLSSMASNAKNFTQGDDDWIEFGVAAGRARVRVKDAIEATRLGALTIDIRDGVQGYAAICVKQTGMDQLSQPRPGHPTLSEFASEVGLQKDGSLKVIYETGYITATELFNPTVPRMGLFMTDKDQATFHAHFTSLKLMADHFGKDAKDMTKSLKSNGIEGCKIDGQLLSKVFLKEAIELVSSGINS